MKKTNSNTKTKTIEKEKVVAETINGRFAMLGLMAAIGAYLTTGQIIPGFVSLLCAYVTTGQIIPGIF